MSTKALRWPRNDAEKVAQGLLSILRPACHRIEIAGSLRRLTDYVTDYVIDYVIDYVGDIGLLCVSRAGGDELFGAHLQLDQEILALIYRAP